MGSRDTDKVRRGMDGNEERGGVGKGRGKCIKEQHFVRLAQNGGFYVENGL